MLLTDLNLRPQEISKVGASEGSSQIYKVVWAHPALWKLNVSFPGA